MEGDRAHVTRNPTTFREPSLYEPAVRTVWARDGVIASRAHRQQGAGRSFILSAVGDPSNAARGLSTCAPAPLW